MFDSKFNLTKFNLADNVKLLNFSRNNVENIDCVAGDKIQLNFRRKFHEKIESDVELHILVLCKRQLVEDIQTSVDLKKYMLMQRKVKERIKNVSIVVKNIRFIKHPTENIETILHLGKLLTFGVISEERLNIKKLNAGKYIWYKRDFSEVIKSETLASRTKHKSFIIDTTIPPGGEIRINSDVFTATLGLQNILHEYHGDWLHFTRASQNLSISHVGGGELLVQVIYNERFK